MNVLGAARRVVLKIGSALVTDWETGRVSAAWLHALALDIVRLRKRGAEVAVVSSGAVALGRRRLGLAKGKLRLQEKQAAAAAGQSILMRAWEEALGAHDIVAAQALLTGDDTENRQRWLNARATLETLLRLGAVPVINENDTVATDEIRVGDNDRLAARVAQMLGADVLILLSDVDGLYTTDPRSDPSAVHVAHVERVTGEIERMAGGANAVTGVGSGGMATKVAAAKIATAAGCAVLIARGDALRPLSALESGARATLFAAAAEPKAAYKAWIAGALKPAGVLRVDAGAARAVRSGKSLLAAGVTGVEGRFGKGEAVRILGPDGGEIARGLIAYDAAEAHRLLGLQSDAIEAALGYEGPAELVHADDLVRVDA